MYLLNCTYCGNTVDRDREKQVIVTCFRCKAQRQALRRFNRTMSIPTAQILRRIKRRELSKRACLVCDKPISKERLRRLALFCSKQCQLDSKRVSFIEQKYINGRKKTVAVVTKPAQIY